MPDLVLPVLREAEVFQIYNRSYFSTSLFYCLMYRDLYSDLSNLIVALYLLLPTLSIG